MKLLRFSRVSPILAIEPLEARIAPATLYVDNPADFTITSDVGTPGLSSGDTVTWNPGFQSAHGAAVGGLIFGTTAFSTIPAAVTAAADGDLIRVGPGDFTGAVLVDKSVSVLGNQVGVSAVNRNGLPETNVYSVDTAVFRLTANGATIDGFSVVALSDSLFPVPTGVVTSDAASGYIIANNRIQGGSSPDGIAKPGIALASDGELETIVFKNSIVAGPAYQNSIAPAISVTGTFAHGRIEGNHVETAFTTGLLFTPASGAGSERVSVFRNVFSMAGTAVGYPTTGIKVGGATRVLSITENVFSGQDTEIQIEPLSPAARVNIHVNSFSNVQRVGKSIVSASTTPIDARYNWFGTTSAADIGVEVTGNVNYTPFLTDGRDMRLDVPGFQSVPSLQLSSNFRVATLLDVDGDVITITTSKGFLYPEFMTVAVAEDGVGVQIQQLFFAGPEHMGADITITAKRSAAGGNNAVNIGSIIAQGVDLGRVVIAGDLGSVFAGDPSTPGDAIKLLQTHSIGRFAATTQVPGLGTTSRIAGAVGAVVVRGNIENAALYLFGPGSDLRSATVGSLLGGSLLADGNIGNVTVRGSIVGSMVALTGAIYAAGKLGNVTVGGSLSATSAEGITVAETAFIRSGGDMGFVKIGGDVIGGATGTARIFTDDATAAKTSRIAGVTIAGSLIGGTGGFSGAISADGALGPVRIAGDVRGVEGDGTHDATISAGNGVASITIGGSLIGVGSISGNIFIEGAAGPIAIKGSIIGGTTQSGNIRINTSPQTSTVAGLKSLTVGGSIIGGQGHAVLSGAVYVDGLLGSVKIGGSLIGGYSSDVADAIVFSGSIKAFSIGKIAITGSIIAPPVLPGTSIAENASIAAQVTIGPVTIGGDMLGTPGSHPTIMAGGLAWGGGLTSVNVRGDVIYSRILAGFAPGVVPVAYNAHGQVGAVTVGGDWIASDLVAGAESVDGFFGNANDAAMTIGGAGIASRIASLVVKGVAAGTSLSSLDHFGIVAQEIGKVMVHGVSYPLAPGAGNDNLSASNRLLQLGSTNDLQIREV